MVEELYPQQDQMEESQKVIQQNDAAFGEAVQQLMMKYPNELLGIFTLINADMETFMSLIEAIKGFNQEQLTQLYSAVQDIAREQNENQLGNQNTTSGYDEVF